MEFFPSTGADQWQLIEESLNASDFAVFILAGRYGSIVPDREISWTHREYREAVARNKRIVVLMHHDITLLPVGQSEISESMRSKLSDFRREIEAAHVVRYWSNDTELVAGLYASVNTLSAGGHINGWIRASPDTVVLKESDFDRAYELVESESLYAKARLNSNLLDMTYKIRRRVRGEALEGVSKVVHDFTRETDALSFDENSKPDVKLNAATRTGGAFGHTRLADPRKTQGAAYVQDILFDPPVAQGEVADFTLSAFVPTYKFAYREDLLAATVGAHLGPRIFDYNARSISFPTRLLVMRVFLPASLGAVFIGPKVGRAGTVDATESAHVITSGQYREWTGEVDGALGRYAEIRVISPRLFRRYRVCWSLPSRRVV